MLLTRNGRFYHDAIYMEEATTNSEDVSDTTVLLHAIRQAFSKLGIDQKQLDEMVNKIDPTIMRQQSDLPPIETSDTQQAKSQEAPPANAGTPPAAQQAAGAGQNPQAAGAQDAIAQTQPNPLEEYAKQEHNKQTKTIQEIQQSNYTPMGTDNILLGAQLGVGGTVDIDNQKYLISAYYPNFKQIDKLINLKSYYPATFIFPDNLVDLIKSGKIKSISPAVIIRYNKPDQPIATVIKGTFNT
jgi:hypothetical protein